MCNHFTYACAECLFSSLLFVTYACASTGDRAKLTDTFPLRSPSVFLIDRHKAEVQALSLVPMLMVESCIFMRSLGINPLNKGWGRWLVAVFITVPDWLEPEGNLPIKAHFSLLWLWDLSKKMYLYRWRKGTNWTVKTVVWKTSGWNLLLLEDKAEIVNSTHLQYLYYNH